MRASGVLGTGERRLDGKRCLVTGGSRGLGRAIAVALARAGAKVAFTWSRRDADAEEARKLVAEAAGGTEPMLFKGSVVDGAHAKATVGALVEAWGGLDVLVNAAGTMQLLPFALIEEQDWDHVMDVNVKGAYLFAREALRPMIRQKRGQILCIGAFSEGRGIAMPPHFAASKAALRGFTEALARDVGAYNIRVNYLAPGLLDVGFARRLPEGRAEDYARHCALGRVGTAAEIAEIAAFLVSDENTFITGARVVADGGI
jgi:NAD(P)-dependent dehydrogenase (short-subunit alcohol dehydrogenase family)